ncbi:MAG: glycosyltransferase family 4 protein [Anaerolineales bacterium]|nr:glycosyltransferase family 4 protein [Anaerolineales bacterium]
MERPLSFCMVTTFYPPYNFGGDGIFVKQLSNELAARGHRVDVIHCVNSYRLLAGRMPESNYNDHPNVTVHGLKSLFGALSPLLTQQTGRPVFKSADLKRILNRDFDVIHYHNISLVGGPKVIEYGKGIKLYTTHEYWLVCPTHVLFRFNRAACTRRNCITCSLIYRRPPQWWRYTTLLQTAIQQVDAFISPSKFGIEKHRELGFDVPFRYIPNFVPAPPQADGLEVEKPYVLFVGRLERIKGLQSVIPVFCRSLGVQLWIAGQGSYESHLKRLAGGSKNIRFLGHLSGGRLQALYRQAVAVVVPSLAYEMGPLVIPEAFQQRTPVIARQMGGLPEIVRESGGGIVYQDEEELAAAVKHLLVDKTFRNLLGQRGYSAFQQTWSAEAHLIRYFSLIRELAASKV